MGLLKENEENEKLKYEITISNIPFWFNQVPEKFITLNETIETLKLTSKENFSHDDFLNELRDNLCTDWCKDYDNEFYTSSDPEIKENAWNLSYEKAECNFLKLRKYYSDEIIFYAIDIVCRLRRDNFESVIRICQMIGKKIKRDKKIWGFIFNWLTKPITRDGKLGIDARLGLKYLKNLQDAPMYLPTTN